MLVSALEVPVTEIVSEEFAAAGTSARKMTSTELPAASGPVSGVPSPSESAVVEGPPGCVHTWVAHA